MRTFCKWFLIISFSFVSVFMLIWTLVDSDESPNKTQAPIQPLVYEESEETTTPTLFVYEEPEDTTTPTLVVYEEPEVTTTTAPVVYEEPTEPEITEPMVQEIFENYASFVPTEEPNYHEITVEWVSPNDDSECYHTMSIDKNAYQYYRSLPRYNDFNDYHYYLDDEYNRAILSSLAESFRRFGREYGLTDDEVILESIRFVQSIPYAYDIDSTGEEEFQKYPVETLFDHEGDCEDTSLLLAGLLRELGCNVCLLHLPGHAAVGIQDTGSFSGRYYEVDGNQYFYIESTNPNKGIGEIPEQFGEATAKVYVID